MFERDGYVEARIVDIAEESKVAVGSFYTHFDGKDDLLATLVHDATVVMLEPGLPARARQQTDPVAVIEATNRAYIESYAEHAGLMRVLEQAAAVDDRFRAIREQRASAFHDRNVRAIRRLQRAGLADPSLDPVLAAAALSGMVSRLAYGALSAGLFEATTDQLVAAATRLWANALQLTS